MNVLREVVEDLALFAFHGIRGLLLPSSRIERPERVLEGREVFPALSSHQEPLQIEAPEIVVQDFSHKKHLQKSTIMYVSAAQTALLTSPQAYGDAIYATLPYGSMVMVLDVQDGWVKVVSGAYVGWVNGEDLEERAAEVYPVFRIGEPHDASHQATVRVRTLIDDTFGAGSLALPLQAEEYVTYRLMRKNTPIPWPPIRPRTPGTWHVLLADVPGTVLRSMPEQGSVMEYVYNNQGHLVLVDAVFPDHSIQISEANWPDRGIYNERVLTSEEWKSLSPQFIIIL